MLSRKSLVFVYKREGEGCHPPPPSTSSVNTVNHFELCLFSQRGYLRKELIPLLRTLLFLSVGQSFELVYQWLVRHSIKFGWIEASFANVARGTQMWLGTRKCKPEAARWLSILWEKYKFCQMECVTFSSSQKGLRDSEWAAVQRYFRRENLFKKQTKNQNLVVKFLLQSTPPLPNQDLPAMCYFFASLSCICQLTLVVSSVFLLACSW